MSKKDVTVGMVYSYEAGLAEGQAEREELRRQLTQHVDWLNERNEQVAELRRQLADEKGCFESMAEHHEAQTEAWNGERARLIGERDDLRRQLADCRKALETEGESDG
jgi:chromosome segregation ATPase